MKSTRPRSTSTTDSQKGKVVNSRNSHKVRVNVFQQEIREKLMTLFPLTPTAVQYTPNIISKGAHR